MNKGQLIFLLSVIGAITLFLFARQFIPKKKWRVVVTFCDKRMQRVVVVESISKPVGDHISTYKQAVPVWEDQVNVCEIESTEIKP